MNNKKEVGNVLLIILVIVAILFALWFLMGKGYLPKLKLTSQVDLNAASQELDKTDLNQIDTGLSRLNSDTSNF